MDNFTCYSCKKTIYRFNLKIDGKDYEFEAFDQIPLTNKDDNYFLICPHCNHEHKIYLFKGHDGLLKWDIEN